MKLNHFAFAAAALAGASLLVPADLGAFALNGSSLSLSQRDIRIFNNFTDTAANDNGNAHAQFPGYTGAPLAVWKAATEWASLPHGDGTGDSTQSVLGNGGANFDASWQGNATAIGGSNDNTISEISGSSGSVLAFAEGPYSDGWRIRFYEGWTWADGPGTLPGGQFDIQGIMAHEYGHALGLGHSSDSSATMFGSASGNGVPDRSINADDIAGLQAIYGLASATKPVITGINKCDDSLEILGTNFAPTGNEVWFTQAGSGGNGNPVKVTNVASTMGGTSLTVTIPANAGSGDVLVKGSGNSFGSLSNAWPMDVTIDQGECGPFIPPFDVVCFGDGGIFGCTACPCGNDAPQGSGGGCLNSSATWAILYANGIQSVSADTLTLGVFGANTNTFAALISGDNQLPTMSSCPPGSGVLSTALDGLRCVGGGVLRHGTRATDSLGANTNPWGPPGAPAGGLIAQGGFVAGQTRHFQVFYREGATLVCSTGQNTSNSLGVTFIP